MNILNNLQRNERGNIIMNRANVGLMMIYISENKISNVCHFVSKELKANVNEYNKVVKKYEVEFPGFYNYYNLILKKSKNETKERIKDVLLYMGFLMRDGIQLEDGTYRKFDVYDWFVLKNKYFDNLNRRDISKILDEFFNESIVYEEQIGVFELRKLISNSYGDSLLSYSEPVYKKYAVENVKHLLSKEEAIKLLDFIDLHHIPLNKNNFDFGVDKMIEQRNNPNNLFEINNNISHNKALTKKRR